MVKNTTKPRRLKEVLLLILIFVCIILILLELGSNIVTELNNNFTSTRTAQLKPKTEATEPADETKIDSLDWQNLINPDSIER